jgi:hypothetical protein
LASSVMAALFPGHAMAPAVRARIAILRDRMNGADGLEVTCVGASMEPVIARGARVRVHGGSARVGACARGGSARVGHVAAFVTDRGELEVHRLVARVPGGWWAHLGDNQVDRSPGLVHASHIVGIADVPGRSPRVVERIRALTRFGRAAAAVARRTLQPR